MCRQKEELEMEPGRYIEKLADEKDHIFVSRNHKLKKALDNAAENFVSNTLITREYRH